ncbi:MAG TPA: DUF3488 and DUF4129 domain-containing transglutaminase family protein, partial [Acidobacteriota bacterium]|nr:DUF3488 and DUF4129 domain-containing transglutaminase family protein [Acidobacteriota bacterium]
GMNRRTLQVTIRFGAFVLVFFSAIALLMTQRLQIASAVLMLATVVAWYGGRKPTHERLWEIASLAYLFFFFYDVFRLSPSLAPALVHLFVFILINKLFNLQTTRDYYQLYLLTFLCVLASASLSVEVETLYMMICYIVLLMWNLAGITLLREWQKQAEENFPFSLFHPVFGLVVLASSAAAFGFALIIFFILPRIQLGYFSNLKGDRLQHVSGFSQKVSLGDISSIGENSGVAMHVRVTSDNPGGLGHLYWRGMAFDFYDGKSWKTTNKASRFLREDLPNEFSVPVMAEPTAQVVKQEFYLEPLDTRVIFGLDRVGRVKGRFVSVMRDGNATLMGAQRMEHYEVYSRLNQTLPARIKNENEPIPEMITQYYLQLPKMSDEFVNLANQLSAEKATTLERIVQVQRYLQTKFKYTTENLPQDQFDPIAVFLFKRKAGSCEYFATSMALLLRQMGIPSRLVNGFLQGEYNDIGDFYVVRQSDAHAWVEVYLNGQWYPVDPSPRPLEPGSGSFFNFSKLLESVSFFWDRYILIFSAQDQIDALTRARDQVRQTQKQWKAEHGSFVPWLLNWLKSFWLFNRTILMLITVLVAVLIFALRIHGMRKRELALFATPILFYQRMLTILRQKGFSKAPSLTPSEFAREIQNSIPANFAPDLLKLTDYFYRSRFGGHLLSEADQQAIKESLTRLQEMEN